MLEKLRKVLLFQELTEEQIQSLPQGNEIWLEPGEKLFEQGEPPDYFYIIFEGAIQITHEVRNQLIVLATYKTGMFFGEVALLAGTFHLASGRALLKSHLYCLKEEDFWQMLSFCPSLRKLVLDRKAMRMQEFQTLSQQREKLISLGTLAAGLAHEVNNPAAAARRATKQLHQPLNVLQNLALKFIKQYLKPVQVQRLIELQHQIGKYDITLNQLDSLGLSEREDELTCWLEEQGVADGWRFSPTLVAAKVEAQQLAEISKSIEADVFNNVVTWLEAALTSVNLMNELDQSICRISELVQAVKDYSYMDRAPLQKIDLHEGLDNTLLILSHKLQKHKIVVVREYEPRLPLIMAHGSQLNQVWTNIIDNAIEACGKEGTIWVRTAFEKDCTIVEIADNGPGIPTEIQSRIFEPFFTTKQMNGGTGLGLEIAYRIIVGQHKGDIRCFSMPHDTRFEMRLPMNAFDCSVAKI